MVTPTAGGPATWTGPVRAVVNATGAWGDLTRSQLALPGTRTFAGTRGSHFFTRHPGLMAALGETAVYAEAADGRLVFLLPVPEGIMVGTTDLPQVGSPDEAVATEAELAYLLNLVHDLFPKLGVQREDLTMHYSGVRPLPYIPDNTPAATTRGHWVQRQPGPPLTLTIVGGKLTVARSLAEQVVREVLYPLPGRRLQTRERLLPGAQNYPSDPVLRQQEQASQAAELALPLATVQLAWTLLGTRAELALRESCASDRALLVGTPLPLGLIRWMLANEWVSTLEDLVERRLLLIYQEPLTRATVEALADLLVAEGRLPESERLTTLAAAAARWHRHYGKHLA